MRNRIAMILLLLPLALAGCKKPEHSTKSSSPIPSATPSATATPTPTPMPTPKKPAIDQNAAVVVFGYHRFVNKVRRPDTEITPQAFEQQMQELKNRGVAVISMQDLLAWKRGEKNIPPRCAIITFDDGWKSQYEVAWPIMKKYNYPFTLFIYTEGVRGGRFGGGEAMSWEQLAEMRDAGVDIQAHSATHQDLKKPYDKVTKHRLNPEEYQQWLEAEIAGSKQLLEEKLGIGVNCFAVPYGLWNQQVKEVAMRAGYEAMFTVYGQPITFRTPNDSIGRYLMEANKPKVFADAIATIATAGGGVAVAQINASDLRSQPADGETVRTATPLVRANLASVGQIDPGSVKLRISGLGLVPAVFDPKTQTVTYQVSQKLRNKSCSVIIEAMSGGKKVQAQWMFAIAESALSAPASPATGLPNASAVPRPAGSPSPKKP